MAKKSKLSQGELSDDGSQNYRSPLAAPHSSNEELVGTTQSTVALIAGSMGRGLKALILTVLFTIFILVVIYTSLAGTLMFAAPVGSSATEKAWVARGTFVGGHASTGTIVYGSATQVASSDLLQKISDGYIGAPDSFIAEVISGPYGKISTGDKKEVVFDGKGTDYYGEVKDNTLNQQYLARCLSGSCAKGELVIVNGGNIIGEVKTIVYPFGAKTIPSSKGVVDYASAKQ
jgi:hypothetical protein